jgi:HK97 family phage prohead protease
MMFAGYAARYGVIDKGGDIIRAGAFAGNIGTPRLLAQHYMRAVVGHIKYVEEDEIGLRVVAQMKQGLSVTVGDGLSFGYRVKKAIWHRGHRELVLVELVEISLSANPMQTAARVTAVSNTDNLGYLIASFGLPRASAEVRRG